MARLPELKSSRPSDGEVEVMFADLMSRRDMLQGPSAPSQEALNSMFEFTPDKKWTLVYNDMLTTQSAEREKQQLAQEYEVLKAFRSLFNTDILLFLCHWEKPQGHRLVLQGIDELKDTMKLPGRFDAWFGALETAIDGRGRMGSLVGASEEFRKLQSRALPEASLPEYVVNNMFLVNALVNSDIVESLKARVHLRSQMTASGLPRIMAKMRDLGTPDLNLQLQVFERSATADNEDLVLNFQREASRDLSNPADLFNLVLERVKDTRAKDFFMSAMQHLLLIQHDGSDMVHYFKLIDSMISTVVLDKDGAVSSGDMASLIGTSVNNVLDRFADQDLMERTQMELKETRLALNARENELQSLQKRLDDAAGGLVGQLEAQLKELQSDLEMSRDNAAALQRDMDEMERSYVDRILGLELELLLLFRHHDQFWSLTLNFKVANHVHHHRHRHRHRRHLLLLWGQVQKMTEKDSPDISSPDAATPMTSNMRKHVLDMAKTRMKQLQWDKLSAEHASSTVWDKASQTEMLLRNTILQHGLFGEMDEEFKAKESSKKVQSVKRDNKELQTYLNYATRQGIEMVLKRLKSRLTGNKQCTPEELAHLIIQCDPQVFDQSLLTELLRYYPESETKGRLGEYKNASDEQLRLLHPADRLVVLLMTVPHLKDKVKGMLYKTKYQDTVDLIRNGLNKIRDGAEAIMDAPNFAKLLSVVLLFGNYLNATGIKGGAYGFKISSINKLVDTKATDGTTLLHFVERAVSNQFPELEGFIDEISLATEACRVQLLDLKHDLAELKSANVQHKKDLDRLLGENEENMEDPYSKLMLPFLSTATAELQRLSDQTQYTERVFTEALRYYGEGPDPLRRSLTGAKSMSTEEFFGIFKEFLTAYRKAKTDNATLAQQP
ncbi:hypothetical protein MCAP1_002035 [Malassezia caprae]|uniref:Uncharacterized protein n=1 Tax=Malassezia caprae TaxID=1381934 RepID=A0AAF0E6B4_9BASI|nr:hypothetical protein MCAP1_002035 [Malassezia caprae]